MKNLFITATALVLGMSHYSALAEETDITLGAELYGEFCSNCHGENAAGLPAFQDSLTTFQDRLEGTTENMPDFAGVFEGAEIAALFAYLQQANAD